jgi:hypothetical protein
VKVGGTAIQIPHEGGRAFSDLKDKQVQSRWVSTPGPLDSTNTGQWYFTTGIAPDLMIYDQVVAIKRMLTYIQKNMD